MSVKNDIIKINGVDHKRCTKCNQMLPTENFSKQKIVKGTGLRPRCKKCVSEDSMIYIRSMTEDQKRKRKEVAALWEKNNREKEREKERIRYHKNKDKTRKKIINHRFKSKGWTKDAYEIQYRNQDGNCAICGIHREKLFIDHCHNTKNIRGLLCSNCNTGIGLMKDNPEILRNAADYLQNNIPLLKAV